MDPYNYPRRVLKALRNASEQIEEHVLAGGCGNQTEYAAALAKLRAFQSIEQFIVELNKELDVQDEL